MADKAVKAPTLISKREAAQRLGILNNSEFPSPDRTILQMIRYGKLEGRRVGLRMMVVEKSLTAFIQSGRGA